MKNIKYITGTEEDFEGYPDWVQIIDSDYWGYGYLDGVFSFIILHEDSITSSEYMSLSEYKSDTNILIKYERTFTYDNQPEPKQEVEEFWYEDQPEPMYGQKVTTGETEWVYIGECLLHDGYVVLENRTTVTKALDTAIAPFKRPTKKEQLIAKLKDNNLDSLEKIVDFVLEESDNLEELIKIFK